MLIVVQTINIHVPFIVQVWYKFTEHVPCLKCRCIKGLRPVMVQGYMFLRKTFFQNISLSVSNLFVSLQRS